MNKIPAANVEWCVLIFYNSNQSREYADELNLLDSLAMYMYDKLGEGWVPSSTKSYCPLSHTSGLLSLTISRTKCWERDKGSLIPRLSHRPVMITCSMQNRGGRPGPFYHVNNISFYLGRQRGGGVPHRKNELKASLRPYLVVSSCPKHWSFECLWSKKLYRFWFKTNKRMHKMRSFDGGSLSLSPHFVYLGRHWCHSRDTKIIKCTRPSPSVLYTASNQKLDSGKAWERGLWCNLGQNFQATFWWHILMFCNM